MKHRVSPSSTEENINSKGDIFSGRCFQFGDGLVIGHLGFDNCGIAGHASWFSKLKIF